METDYNEKIIKILQKFLDHNFKIKKDLQLDSLLTHLLKYLEKSSEETRRALKAYLTSWIEKVVSRWGKQRKYQCPAVLSFTLSLTSFICKDEQNFVLLNSRNVYERLFEVIDVKKPTTHPSVKICLIKLLSSFLEHKSGLQWIISTNYWTDIMYLALNPQQVNVRNEGCQFVATLLANSVKINELYCFNIVEFIVSPLSKYVSSVPSNRESNVRGLENQTVSQTLRLTLRLLYKVLRILLETVTSDDNFTVLVMLKDKFNLENQIRSLLAVAQNEDFVIDLYKTLFVILLSEMYVRRCRKQAYVNYNEESKKSTSLLNFLKDLMENGSVINVVKLTHIGYSCWQKIGYVMPACVKDVSKSVPLLFENQMLLFLISPMIAISLKFLGEKETERLMYEDEVRGYFEDQIMRKASLPTMRLYYYWRDNLVNNPFMFRDATVTLSLYLKSRATFTNDQAVMLFQLLIYSWQDFVILLKRQNEDSLVLAKEFEYIARLLEAVAIFIKEFTFTWRDSLESISVLNIAMDFLSMPWPDKVVVNTLKVVDMSIAKYLTPNMALLLDDVHDSSITGIGPMLQTKLSDSNWEVRNSALDVLCTISHNANVKFPSLKVVVLKAQLPSMALKMALLDNEPSVRATAVKCLQEMVKVKAFWNNLLESCNVYEEIIQIFQKETDGNVQGEAASLLVDIYENRDVPPNVLTQYYEIMVYASTTEVHCDVKVNALFFWKKVIDQFLTHQGMIDGAFPEVTFSKEHRKIVTLTNAEIKKRLVKVLGQLSETGCLTALVGSLRDDSNLRVWKTSRKIVEYFVKLLKDYNVGVSDVEMSLDGTFTSVPYFEVRQGTSSGVPTPMSQISDSSPQNPYSITLDHSFTDSVLDALINFQNVCVLNGIGSNPTSDNCSLDRFKNGVTPGDFLRFIDTDVNNLTSDKICSSKGVNEFGSLLDGILRNLECNGEIPMDCK